MTVALICPRCKGRLSENGASMTCLDCAAEYSSIDGVPVLLPEGLSDQHAQQLDYFDAEFAGYREYAVENWRQSYIDRIFAALGVLEGNGPYLDVGVGGSGATVIEAARRGVEALGCDLSAEGVLAAQRFARSEGVAERVELVVSAAEALPFPDASVGSASAVAVLEHLDDDRPAVAELARVLRPGGMVWLMVPHAFRYMPPPVWPLYWWHDRRIGHKRHYDERALVELCESAGLVHVGTYYGAHTVKLLQAALTKLVPAMRKPGSRAWWRLEELDRRADGRRWWAVHLNGVFRRP